MKPFVRQTEQKHWFIRVLFVELFIWKPQYQAEMKPGWGVSWVDGLTIHTPPVSLCFIPVRWLWEG